MALDPILWAMKDAPTADAQEFAVLVTMAESADDDGCNAYQSTRTLAKRTKLSERTVQRRIDDMLARGLLALGNQRYAPLLTIPEHLRPVNYDVCIPFAWFGNVGRINEWRARERRLGPLTPNERPMLGAPPEKKRRSDFKGAEQLTETPAAAQSYEAKTVGGDYESPPDYKSPGASETVGGDYESPRGCQAVTQPSPITLPLDPPLLVEPDGTTQSNAVLIDLQATTRPETDGEGNTLREDVERVCTHLADRIEANGCKRPTITNRWRDAARRLMDLDNRTEAQVHNMIDWCTTDEFWRANILSMPKLREKYDQMKLRAMQTTGPGARAAYRDEAVHGTPDELAAALAEANNLTDEEIQARVQAKYGSA